MNKLKINIISKMIEYKEKLIKDCTKEDFETTIPKENLIRYGCIFKDKNTILIPIGFKKKNKQSIK